MSTIDSYLKALLALSGDEQLVSPRRALLQSLNDEDLAELVTKVVGREFARYDLEDIASVLLDVVVKDPASVHSHAASEDQATSVKGENNIHRGTTPASVTLPAPRSTSQASTSGAQSQIGHASHTVAVSLRCQTEQVIANKVVPPIQYVRWDQVSGKYIDFYFGSHNTAEETSLAERFDRDYLSTECHIQEWGKLLRLLEKGVASRCCVSDTVIGGSKHHSLRVGFATACNRCIKTKRLCARLSRMAPGVIKLALYPLPLSLWDKDDVNPLSQWVCS